MTDHDQYLNGHGSITKNGYSTIIYLRSSRAVSLSPVPNRSLKDGTREGPSSLLLLALQYIYATIPCLPVRHNIENILSSVPAILRIFSPSGTLQVLDIPAKKKIARPPASRHRQRHRPAVDFEEDRSPAGVRSRHRSTSEESESVSSR
jgi:hypothetical protein